LRHDATTSRSPPRWPQLLVLPVFTGPASCRTLPLRKPISAPPTHCAGGCSTKTQNDFGHTNDGAPESRRHDVLLPPGRPGRSTGADSVALAGTRPRHVGSASRRPHAAFPRPALRHSRSRCVLGHSRYYTIEQLGRDALALAEGLAIDRFA